MLETAVEAERTASAAEQMAFVKSIVDLRLQARLLRALASLRKAVGDDGGALMISRAAIDSGKLTEQELLSVAAWFSSKQKNAVDSLRLAFAAYEQILRRKESIDATMHARPEWMQTLAELYQKLDDQTGAARARTERG